MISIHYYLIIISLLCSVIAPAAPDLETQALTHNQAFLWLKQHSKFPVSADPFEQYLLWEEQANFMGYRNPIEAVDIPLVSVPIDELHIKSFGDTPDEIGQLFTNGEFLNYPLHPNNKDPRVAYRNSAKTGSWDGRYTASRTMVIWSKDRKKAYGLKMPTNHPHGNIVQTSKTNLEGELETSIKDTQYVNTISTQMKDPREALTFLNELLTVTVRHDRRSGFILRDLSPLQDGFYYMPAFAVPFLGREIADYHDVPYATFWQKHYTEAMGKILADLFLYYGLTAITPIPQNFVIQLDHNLMPTGKIIVRDLADYTYRSSIVRPLLTTLEFQHHITSLPEMPEFEKAMDHVFFGLDVPESQMTNDELADWKNAFRVALLSRIFEILKEPIPKEIKTTRIEDILNYLLSTPGQYKLSSLYSKEIFNTNKRTWFGKLCDKILSN